MHIITPYGHLSQSKSNIFAGSIATSEANALKSGPPFVKLNYAITELDHKPKKEDPI
jgi:hypothetical protein